MFLDQFIQSIIPGRTITVTPEKKYTPPAELPMTLPGAEPLPLKTGQASWYGNELRGRPTASGELFNPDDLTAASWDYPFGTKLKVTNLDTGKSVIVRVNDRGPNQIKYPKRVIDLSQAAFKQIADPAQGLIKNIKIEPISTKPSADMIPTVKLTEQPSEPLQIGATPLERLWKGQEVFTPGITEFGKPILKEYTPTENVFKNFIKELPEQTLKFFPFTRLWYKAPAKTLGERVLQIEDEAIDFLRGIAQLYARAGYSAYSLLKGEDINKQIKQVPILGQVSTYERDAYENLMAGASPLEAGISLGAEAAITSSLIAGPAMKAIRTLEPKIRYGTLETTLSKQDISDITAGRITTGPKVEAFKEAINSGIRIAQQIKNGKSVVVKVKTPSEIGEILYSPINKQTISKAINLVQRWEPQIGLTIKDISRGIPEEPIKPIPKELEPSVQEARKYKTLEKIFKNTIYKKYLLDNGAYFELAVNKKTGDAVLNDVFVPENLRLKGIGSQLVQDALQKLRIDFPEVKTISGFAGSREGRVLMSKFGITEAPSKFIDIYNQAIKGIKEIKPEVKLTAKQQSILEAEYQKEFETIKKETEDKLFRDIKGLGGIKTDPTIKEEMSDLPIDIMRKDGYTPDEIARELNGMGYNFEDGMDLVERIKEIRTMPTRYRPAQTSLQKMKVISVKMSEAVPKEKVANLEKIAQQIVREATIGRPTPPIKPTIAKATGLKPIERLITKGETALLKMRLKAEERGAKRATMIARRETRDQILSQLREEKKEIEDVRKQITDYAKQNLEPRDRGRAMVIVRDAKTQEDLTKAFVRIERWAEQLEKKSIRNDILKLSKKLTESPSVAIDYKNRINEVLSNYELKGHTQALIGKLEATKKYINERIAKGEDVELPQRIWRAVDILARTPFDQIPLRTLENIYNEIQFLGALGKTKWRSRMALYNAEKETIKDALLKEVRPIQYRKIFQPEPGEKITASQKMKNFIINAINKANKIDKVIAPIDVLMDILNGAKGTYTGAHMSMVKGRIDYNFNQYLNLKDSLQDPIIELAEKLKLKKGNFERIGIIAASEQEGGIEKLKNIGITEEDIAKIKLTNEEQQMLDKMREIMESQFPAIQQIMRNVFNQPVGKVKNYFSFMTNWKAMDEAEVFQRMGPNVEEFGKPTKHVEMGFTKERTSPGQQKIQINALKIFMKHTDNVAYLLTMGRDTKMIYEIFNSPEYKEKAGDLAQLLMLEWIDVIARKGGGAGANQIAILDTLRKNIGAGILGLKITSAAIQWTSLIDGMGMIGPTWGLKGAANMASKEWRQFMMKFPELRERAGGEYAIQELIEGNWFNRIQEKGFLPLEMIDKITAMSVGSGAYEKKMQEMGKNIDLTKDPDPEALKYAQLAVRRTQASMLFKDVPLAVSRGVLTGNRSVDKTIFQFQNFLLFRWSRIEHDAIRVGIETKSPKQAINVLFWIILASLAATGTRMGVNKLMDFILGREDKKKEKLIAATLKNMLYEITGTIPFMGNIFGSYMYDNSLVPILEVPSTAIQGAKSAITGKSLITKAKGINNFLTSIMAMQGVPGAMQAQGIIRKWLSRQKAVKPTGPILQMPRATVTMPKAILKMPRAILTPPK